MCKFNPKNDSRRIDLCMKNVINFLWGWDVGVLACCCGHGKYPMTIVVKEDLGDTKEIYEIFSGKTIPRKKRFYKKDKQGYYYIPEVIKK